MPKMAASWSISRRAKRRCWPPRWPSAAHTGGGGWPAYELAELGLGPAVALVQDADVRGGDGALGGRELGGGAGLLSCHHVSRAHTMRPPVPVAWVPHPSGLVSAC